VAQFAAVLMVCFCLWSLISPLMYGTCGSILVYYHFSTFFFLTNLLFCWCSVWFVNSQTGPLLPLLSWLCVMVWNSNFCYFPYTANHISTLSFLLTSHFSICVLPLSILTFSDDKCYQNFILGFTFAVSLYRISTYQLYTFVEGRER